jgi:serine/threonine protein kinase
MGGCCSRDVAQKDPVKLRRSSSIIKDSTLRDIKEKYEFLSLLGNGGFGKVRLYRDKDSLKMKYAIKTLQKNFLNHLSI